MTRDDKELRELLNKRLQKRNEIFSGKVKSVDEDKGTMEVWPDEELKDYVLPVMLRSSVTDLKGIVVIPKVNSEVAFAAVDGHYTIVNASELDKVLVDVPEMQVSCKKVVFNGGDNGALIIIKKLVDELNKLQRDNNKLKNAFNAWVVTPQDGGAKLYAAAKAWAGQPLTETQVTQLENKQIKH